MTDKFWCIDCGSEIDDAIYIKKTFGTFPSTCKTCRGSSTKDNICLYKWLNVKVKSQFKISPKESNEKTMYWVSEFGGKNWKDGGEKYSEKYIMYINKNVANVINGEIVFKSNCSLRKMKKVVEEVEYIYLVFDEPKTTYPELILLDNEMGFFDKIPHFKVLFTINTKKPKISTIFAISLLPIKIYNFFIGEN